MADLKRPTHASAVATSKIKGVQRIAQKKSLTFKDYGRGGSLLTSLAVLLASCSSGQMRSPGVGNTENSHPVRTENSSRDPAEIKRDSRASAEFHFSMAQAYVAEGNPDRAIEEYKLTLMYDPSSPLVYVRLATEFVKKAMLSAAMDSCQEALKKDPKYVDARMMLAGLYSSSHENESAFAEYERVLKDNPRNEEAAVYRAQVLADLGKITEARQGLRSFVKKNSDSALAWYSLGRAEESMDNFKGAVVAYKKSIDLKSSFNQPALSLGYLYETQKMNAQAIGVYQALWEETQDGTAANRLATIYLKEEKYDQALPFLESLQAMDPDDLNARVKLGLIQMQLKQYQKAIVTFNGILERTPDSDRVRFYLGSLHEQLKNWDQAIAQLKRISPESKMYSDAVLHVAYLTKEQKGLDQARSYINGEIERAPRIASFYIYSASIEEDAKNMAAAVSRLEKAVALFPEDEKVRYYLGSLYDRQGQVEQGMTQMEAILYVNPENVDALNYMGYTWTTKGIRLNDAEKMLRKAMALRPNNGFITDSWGWYLFTCGRLNEAVIALEKAARLQPKESTILEHLADAYLRSNLREKALQKYAEAAQYADDEKLKQKIASKHETLETELAEGGKNERNRMPASVNPKVAPK